MIETCVLVDIHNLLFDFFWIFFLNMENTREMRVRVSNFFIVCFAFGFMCDYEYIIFIFKLRRLTEDEIQDMIEHVGDDADADDSSDDDYHEEVSEDEENPTEVDEDEE